MEEGAKEANRAPAARRIGRQGVAYCGEGRARLLEIDVSAAIMRDVCEVDEGDDEEEEEEEVEEEEEEEEDAEAVGKEVVAVGGVDSDGVC